MFKLNNFINEDLKDAVWQKGYVISGKDPNIWRKDIYGNFIKYDQYGNRDSKYGWEIDHIIPQSKGGSDDLSNLQPLQWEKNCLKGNKYIL